MAEAFARAYGSDVLIPASAGLAPAYGLPGITRRAMAEKNLDISDHFPKDLRQLANAEFDLIINISGYPLPLDDSVTIKEWEVADPIGMDYEDHCGVRD